MKFELDDQTVLKLSGLSCCAYGLMSYIAPEQINKLKYEDTIPTSTHATRMSGLITGTTGTLNLSVCDDDDLSTDGRKKLLKANGAAWAAVAAQTLYNTENSICKKEYGYGNAAFMAVMSALCLWRGFKDENAKDE